MGASHSVDPCPVDGYFHWFQFGALRKEKTSMNILESTVWWMQPFDFLG